MSALPVGTALANGTLDPEARILSDDPALRRFVDRAFFRAYVARHVGGSFTRSSRARRHPVVIPLTALVRHALICGSTGSGKSRLLLHVCRLLIARGSSLVLIDPKGETADQLIAWTAGGDLPPEAVVVFDPRQAQGVPGCNPFLADVPPVQAVTDFVALVKASASSWGPRLEDLLTNAFLIVVYHRLSLDELFRLLTVPAYREALVALHPRGPVPLWYEEAWRYFSEEFGRWSPSDQITAVAPVLNKLRELLRSPYLRALLCSRRSSLRFDQLWQQPGVVVVRLDRVALGEEGSRWLAGLVTNLLFRTALRAPGPVPVALVIDELPVLESFVGAAIAQIVTIARSQGLCCLAACQHLAQISDALRETLLANAAVQVFFRVGQADSRLIASTVAVGTEPRVSRVMAALDRVDRRTGLPEMASWSHVIQDSFGRPLRLEEGWWHRFCSRDLFGGDGVVQLLALARSAGVPRVYVQAPDTGEPIELRAYLAGLRPEDYWITGPAPLELVVAFPRPKLHGIERWSESDAVRAWTRCLMDLPIQQAVVRIAGKPPQVIRVVDVPTPRTDRARVDRFLAASLAANGQSAAEIRATYRWRQEEMQRLIHGGPAIAEADDGSVW